MNFIAQEPAPNADKIERNEKIKYSNALNYIEFNDSETPTQQNLLMFVLKKFNETKSLKKSKSQQKILSKSQIKISQNLKSSENLEKCKRDYLTQRPIFL